MSINRKEYEINLKEKQRRHLQQVNKKSKARWQPCMHDGCPECYGTGVKKDGSSCIHHISCPCPKCSPTY